MVGADCAMAGAATAVVPASTRPDFKTSRRFIMVLPRLSCRFLQGPRQSNRGIVAQIERRARRLACFIGSLAGSTAGAVRECLVRRHPKPEGLGADQPHDAALAPPIGHRAQRLDKLRIASRPLRWTRPVGWRTGHHRYGVAGHHALTVDAVAPHLQCYFAVGGDVHVRDALGARHRPGIEDELAIEWKLVRLGETGSNSTGSHNAK